MHLICASSGWAHAIYGIISNHCRTVGPDDPAIGPVNICCLLPNVQYLPQALILLLEAGVAGAGHIHITLP